jgi:hypothetical protein
MSVSVSIYFILMLLPGPFRGQHISSPFNMLNLCKIVAFLLSNPPSVFFTVWQV